MKRIFDIGLSAISLLALAPPLALIGLTILLSDGWPVLFRQVRIGYRGKEFWIYKFRTMVRDADKLDRPLTIGDDPRITRLGYWLRAFKIDELPQLFNVLVGDMSFVGPRPEVPRYVAVYSPEQRSVLDLLPGITDAASICFFNENEMLRDVPNPEQTYLDEILPKKIRLNLYYAKRASLLHDCGIIFKTLTRMCRIESASLPRRLWH